MIGQLAEIEWAHIYKETIRGRSWLEELSISPGRWAGNYSFFYVLVRILSDYKPNRILEFGLGESSKLVSTFIDNELKDSTHLVIEQSPEWIEKFNSRFSFSANTSIFYLPMIEKFINGFSYNGYQGIENSINENFDLYIIDGPFGSDRYSRFDICNLANTIKLNDEFIILFDDYSRIGENDTVNSLLEIFQIKGIKVFTGIYSGNKAQIILATEKYKYSISM